MRVQNQRPRRAATTQNAVVNKMSSNRTVNKKAAPKKKGGKKAAARTKTRTTIDVGKGLRAFGRFLCCDGMVKVYGVIFVAFSLLLLISTISYGFHHSADASHVLSATPPNNIARSIGAHLAHYVSNYTFGIASLGFAFLFFLYGMRLIGINFKSETRDFSLLKITITVLLTMSCLSLILGSFVPEKYEFLAGAFGLFVFEYLRVNTGLLITTLIITIFVISVMVLCYHFSIKNAFLFIGRVIKNAFTVKEPIREPQVADNQTVTSKQKKQKTPKEDSEIQDLDALYIEERNGLNSGMDGNVFHFDIEKEDDEADNSPQNDADERQESALVPSRNRENTNVAFEIIDSQVADNEPFTNDSLAEDEDGDDFEVENNEPENSGAVTTALPSASGPYEPRKDLSLYQFPSVDLLKDYSNIAVDEEAKRRELTENKERIENTLKSFKIDITKISAIVGPTVTLYEIVPAEGIRISKIKNLENDIALSLAALGIRIIAPIPGKGTIGIEVPNKNPNIVSMKEIITSEKFQNNKFELPIGLGKTISNEPFVVDLAKMPHMLMAGATGQGKSVGLNAVITSLLYKKHPAEMKMVLIDPKKVEFPLYSVIEKHYLAKLPDEEEPIITDTKKVIRTLNSLCIEMDTRYDLLKLAKVRNIKEYNAKFCRRDLSPAFGHRFLPYIVLIIDEFGDLIMTAGREVEVPIARLAQLARAVGLHLIIATQRPSVKIISGNIKANFPARVAFRVSARIDSLTILDATGADQLIGKGDMLLSTGSDLLRLQCAFVDTPEVESIANFISEQQSYPEAFMLPEYVEEKEDTMEETTSTDKIDALFMDSAMVVVQAQIASTSSLQRKFNIGYPRAGKIMDQLEEFGIVSAANGSKPREVKVHSTEELRLIFDRLGL